MPTTPPRNPDADEVAALRAWIASEFNRARPSGMTPLDGVLYQPIPFAEFADLPCERDSSEDRYRMLRAAVDYGDARVLDLGCANGFFLFRLATSDAGIVEGAGFDHFPDNVRLASELVRLYDLGDRLRFRRGSVSPGFVEERLAEGPWDVCHLLSVHHHLIRQLGGAPTREILRRLYESCGTLVLEQGSLTVEEYREWTGRDEPFDSGSFTRFVSMLESAGIPADACWPLGHAMYLSGLRDDRAGSRRALVACSRARRGRGVNGVWRKRHRNGIFMELLRTGGPQGEEIWKNVVTGPSLARREQAALAELAGESGFPVLVDPATAPAQAAQGLIRMRALELRQVAAADGARLGARLRDQLVERLMTLARHGLIHNEIVPGHLFLDPDDRLTLLDFETVYPVSELRSSWLDEVFAPNPALGLGIYPREKQLGGEFLEVDLIAADAVLASWGLAALTAAERAAYLGQLRSAGAGA